MLEGLRKRLLGIESLASWDDGAVRRTLPREIATGDIITFALLEQKDISGKSCIVGTPTLYQFNQQQFHSYPLYSQDHKLLCSMIVANREGRAPYLALSRKIPIMRKKELFTDEDYARLARGEIPFHLYAREHTGGMADWLYMHYEVKIREAKGSSISAENQVKHFTYGLYISVKEHKALEIERFPSGDFDLHATVFRPATDIVSVEHKGAMKAGMMPKSMMDSAPETAVNAPKSSAQIFDLTAVAKPIAPVSEEKLPAKPAFVPTGIVPYEAAIQCNLRMASKLIDEALRSDIRVSDVIRKALGLKVAEMDFIAFDLRLNANDYRVLAERFDVDVNDKATIHHCIMEELGHFTGEKSG